MRDAAATLELYVATGSVISRVVEQVKEKATDFGHAVQNVLPGGHSSSSDSSSGSSSGSSSSSGSPSRNTGSGRFDDDPSSL